MALPLLLTACSGSAADHRVVATIAGGDPERGEHVIRTAGCGACHEIPGIRGASGTVGPPLTRLARRSYLAGRISNTPDNLVRWILDPQSIDPQTVMPDLGLTDQQGRDVAAYLYTLR